MSRDHDPGYDVSPDYWAGFKAGRAEVDRYREALHDIHEQATRKNRATDEREYLLRDLDFIAEKAAVGGDPE